MTTNDGGSVSPDLVGELKKLVLEAMSKRLDHMFESADSVLLGMSEKTRNSVEQRQLFDLKHIVRKNRAELARHFKEELASSFVTGGEGAKKTEVGDLSLDELDMAKTRTIEESIAVNNIAVKAENQNEKTLGEIGQRLEYLIQERGAAASPKALSPATLCNAFRMSTQSLDLDFQSELVIYKLFDQLVVSTLNEVYNEALKMLERGGVTASVVKTARRANPARYAPGGRPAGPSAPHAHSAGPSAPPAHSAGPVHSGRTDPGMPAMPQHAPGAEDIPEWATATTHFLGQTPGFAPQTTGFSAMPGPGPGAGAGGGGRGAPPPGVSQVMRSGGMPTSGMPALDARTLDAFRSARRAPVVIAADYGDADLATELSQMASGQMVAGWEPPQARANLQVADLVGRMFNGIVEDPSVPQTLRPQLDDLRFAVIKSAMADRSFFANPEHPIRKLINELATMAAAARTTGAGSVGQLGSLVSMIQSQFQVAARDVRAAAATATPLAEGDAERFLEQQQANAKARRQALIDKARQVIREVLQLQLMGRRVPDPAQPILFTGLAPLLGLRLLRKGMDSDAWREEFALLEKVVEALDPKAGPPPDEHAADTLCAQIELELTQAGMLASRTNELLGGLRQGLEQARHRPAAPASPPAAAAAQDSASRPERPIAQLLRLLDPGAWFKVHDAEHQQTRWLKVVAQYLDDSRPEFQGRVEFAEFSGANPLRIKVEDLLEHIAAGKTEPFDQSPVSKSTLGDLIQRQKAFMAAAGAA